MNRLKLSDAETALYRETGARGAAFRRALRDRVAEMVRESRRPVEVRAGEGRLIDVVETPGGADALLSQSSTERDGK